MIAWPAHNAYSGAKQIIKNLFWEPGRYVKIGERASACIVELNPTHRKDWR